MQLKTNLVKKAHGLNLSWSVLVDSVYQAAALPCNHIEARMAGGYTSNFGVSKTFNWLWVFDILGGEMSLTSLLSYTVLSWFVDSKYWLKLQKEH